MTEDIFKDLCLCGETTKVQFKESFTSQKEIAKEMIAFANTKGGVILFGVEDKYGKLVGLSYDEIQVISPGALAGGLTEEDIRNGKTYQRNPYMATFATNALYYKGIGSGIVRILAEYPEIRLENDVNGKEFKVAIPRTIPNGSLKYRNTTQKDSLKDSNTILKTDVATQKDSLKDSNTILKALEPIQAEVLKYIMVHPQATREEIADSIDGISFGGVKFIIAKLQKKGLLKRVGGRKFGEWLVFI